MASANGRKSQQRRKKAPPSPERRRKASQEPGAVREQLAAVGDELSLLEGLFTHSPVPYAVFNPQGVCLLTNPAYRALFGREPPPEYNVFRDEV